MTVQDLSISIYLIDEKKEYQPGLLKVQHNNGNVSLSFYRELLLEVGARNRQQERRTAQIPDHVFQLSDFTMIEMNSTDRLKLSLRGSRSRCPLSFKSENDVTQFLDYIGQKVCLKHSDCHPCVFLLESLDCAMNTVTPFLATVLPKPAKASGRISLNKMQTHGLMFESDSPIRRISADEYRSLFDVEGKILPNVGFPGLFFNVEIDQSVSGELWKLLVNPDDAVLTIADRRRKDDENREVYLQIKRQWQSTTPKQWANHQDLRALVNLLERDLKAHSNLFQNFAHPKSVMKMAFNVFLTLSVFNWDGAAYFEGLVTFLAPFLSSFVLDAEGENATRPNGEIAPAEEIEADIFGCFSRFYEDNKLSGFVCPSKYPFLKQLFIAVGSLLEQHFPELLQLLYQKHVYSLEFLRDDLRKWFTTCFEFDDIKRLWMSILSFSSVCHFFQCFTVSMLFSLAPAFLEINPLNCEEFVKRFHTLKKRVRLDLLLVNTQKTRELTAQKVTEQPK
jgi:hypothetical protein